MCGSDDCCCWCSTAGEGKSAESRDATEALGLLPLRGLPAGLRCCCGLRRPLPCTALLLPLLRCRPSSASVCRSAASTWRRCCRELGSPLHNIGKQQHRHGSQNSC
jgi:hypothetical protein